MAFATTMLNAKTVRPAAASSSRMSGPSRLHAVKLAVPRRQSLRIRAGERDPIQKTEETIESGGRDVSDGLQAATGITQEDTTFKSSTAATNPSYDFAQAMSFSGPAPERINSRLAMLAFVAAAGAEIATGQSVLSQIKAAPVPIALTFVLFSVASLIPIFKGKGNPEKFENSVFSSRAELWNGRAAMLGFVALLGLEAWKGGSWF